MRRIRIEHVRNNRFNVVNVDTNRVVSWASTWVAIRKNFGLRDHDYRDAHSVSGVPLP